MNKVIESVLMISYIVIISLLFIGLLIKHLPLILFGAIALPVVHIICHME